jgi:chromosome segregation ATPase
MLVYLAIAVALSAAIIGAGFVWLRKKTSTGDSGAQEALLKQVTEKDKAVSELLKRKETLYSNAGFDDLKSKVAAVGQQAETERNKLKEIEVKLESAQKLVEGKEQEQQETKAAKEEDLVKVQELLANYDAIESASVELEQKLAASLKSLDSIMTEVAMTAPQKEVLQSLSNAVTDAGSRLRDLIVEAQTVNERLQGLTMQHQELESEYTRLVEQQLGE